MWNVVSIPLNASGVGNANLILTSTQIFGSVFVDNQAAINGGVTNMVISHLLPVPTLTVPAILTVTGIPEPYFNTVQRAPVNGAGVAQTNTAYELCGSLNISITGGVANQTAQVCILLSDNNP